MKPLVLVIFTALAFTQPLFAGQSDPALGQGLVTGFKEEPNSFWVDSAQGRFQVVIERSGREARTLIHQERSVINGGKSLEAIQAEMNRSPSAHPKYSIFIGITEDGMLIGATKKIPNPSGGAVSAHRNYIYPLNEDGQTKRVILSGGRIGDEPALFVKMITSSGTDKSWIVLTALDAVVVKMEL